EDDEPSIDPLPPERLHVLPRNPRDVDRTVGDPKRPLGRARHASVTSFGVLHWLLGTRSRVELELVEVAERGAAGADARLERARFVVGELAERALHTEVRDVEVFLVDDRRDARVDL